jgi:hypothetical protein
MTEIISVDGSFNALYEHLLDKSIEDADELLATYMFLRSLMLLLTEWNSYVENASSLPLIETPISNKELLNFTDGLEVPLPRIRSAVTDLRVRELLAAVTFAVAAGTNADTKRLNNLHGQVNILAELARERRKTPPTQRSYIGQPQLN